MFEVIAGLTILVLFSLLISITIKGMTNDR